MLSAHQTPIYGKSLVWFRRDLRDYDRAALYHALNTSTQVYCVFIFAAQPWFRIFNPITQSERFDAQGKFIRKYVPELAMCVKQRAMIKKFTHPG